LQVVSRAKQIHEYLLCTLDIRIVTSNISYGVSREIILINPELGGVWISSITRIAFIIKVSHIDVVVVEADEKRCSWMH
jgi:hypothetical protein